MNENYKIIKSELIELIAEKQGHLSFDDVEDSVNCILDHMSEALQNGDRIEIRGFGAFSLRKRRAMMGRNPKTGERVSVPEKYVPHFKPGKILLESLNSYPKPQEEKWDSAPAKPEGEYNLPNKPLKWD